MVALQHQAMNDAVDAGQLGEGAGTSESVYLVSTFVMGVLSQAMANEPELPWGQGPLHAVVLQADGPARRRLSAASKKASSAKRTSAAKPTR